MNLEEFRKALSSDATEENAQLLSENLRKIFRISDEKSLSATNADALIIRNARKRFVKPGNTTNRKINKSCKS